MKRFLLSIVCMTLILGVKAQSQDYLTFRTMDGTEKSLPVDGLKITFEGGRLHAVAQGENASFDLSDMSLMFFAVHPTAIESVQMEADDVSIVNGRVVSKVPNGAAVRVYTLDGRQVGNQQLRHGVYLVEVNGRTFKLLAK